MMHRTIGYLPVAFALLACQMRPTPSPEALRLDSALARVHSSIRTSRAVNPSAEVQFIELGEHYCANHRDSVRCPRFYYTAAFLMLHRRQNPELAIKYLHRIVLDYPNSPRAPDALWQKALIYESMGKPQGARSAYKSLITRYPNDSLAQLARQAIRLIDSLPLHAKPTL